MRKLIFALLIILVLLVAGCSKVYVCYDGTQQKNPEKCPIVPVPTVAERDAERAVDNYGNAYALGKGDRFTRVNTYREAGHWYSEVLFTNARTGDVSQVKLKIDGKTTSISCVSGCDYLGLTDSTE